MLIDEDSMRQINAWTKKSAALAVALTSTSVSIFNSAIAEENQALAFPDKWMIRAGAYFIDKADTTITVLSNAGIGAGVNYKDELGGEESGTVPRIDAYYRFNDKHRIDFTTFEIDRSGKKTITADLQIGDETYYANETVISDIKYTLYKVAYGYSFYRSPEVELSVTAGLNITRYDMQFSQDSGANVETAGFTAPLPTFGLHLSYAMTPKWSINYVAESFVVDIEDKFKGVLLNNELNVEYRLLKNFALGAGAARSSIDASLSTDDWSGRVTDSYHGYTLFGTLYF
jgi:hypothetical protein